MPECGPMPTAIDVSASASSLACEGSLSPGHLLPLTAGNSWGENCNFFLLHFFFSSQVAKERSIQNMYVHSHQIGQLQELKKKTAMLFG